MKENLNHRQTEKKVIRELFTPWLLLNAGYLLLLVLGFGVLYSVFKLKINYTFIISGIMIASLAPLYYSFLLLFYKKRSEAFTQYVKKRLILSIIISVPCLVIFFTLVYFGIIKIPQVYDL